MKTKYYHINHDGEVVESKIQTIDVNAMEWFDRVNGNSYFAARVTINFGTPEARTLILPFQYGYGQHYLDQAFAALCESEGFDPAKRPLWSFCQDSGIILRYSKQENCRKRDVKAFGTEG